MPNSYREIPFRFELPIEVWEKAGAPGKERRIGGMISTEGKDRQGEVVLQRGLNFSEFIKNGWFNDNHSRETSGIVGYPTRVEKRRANGKPGHYVEGYLLEGHEPSDKIWNLAQSLQKTNRRLGFSIEGSVVRRDGMDGKTIAEAKVRNVAITNCPVNVETGLDILAKSMMAMEAAEKADGSCWSKGKCCGKCDCADKALAAGQAVAAPAPAPGEGFPLRVESLEEEPKKVTKSEAIETIQRRFPTMSTREAERVFNIAKAS